MKVKTATRHPDPAVAPKTSSLPDYERRVAQSFAMKTAAAASMGWPRWLCNAHIAMAGIVAGEPIEPIPQTERDEVPKSMLGRGDTFALRVKGSSMRDDGILSGDVVVVQKQSTVRNGLTVIALVNGDATIKRYYHKAGSIELHSANDTMNPIPIKATDTFQIEVLVVGVIRHLGR